MTLVFMKRNHCAMIANIVCETPLTNPIKTISLNIFVLIKDSIMFLQVTAILRLSPLPVVYFAFFLQSLVFHLLYLLLLMLVKYLPLYFQHCGVNISILLNQLSRKYKITKKEDGNEKKKEIEKR